MLGRLHMTTEEALRHYGGIAGSIFNAKNKKRVMQDGTFKASTLEAEVRKVVAGSVAGYTGDETMYDGTTDGVNKTGKASVFISYEGIALELIRQVDFRFVCAVPGDNWAHPRLFRTYKVPKNPSADCKIWEAARATTAAPTFFKGIEISGGGGIKERFIDAGVKCNNPAKQVVEEARNLFGDKRRLVVISIGSGHPGVIGLPKPDAFQRILPVQLMKALANIATDCEEVATELEKQYDKLPDTYLRFNVTHGAGQVSLEEWKKISEVITHTRSYLEDLTVGKGVDLTVQSLCNSASVRTQQEEILC